MIGGEAMVTDCTRARFGRGFRLGAVASEIAVLCTLLPALLIAAPAQSASLMNNVGPRLPTNIGPRGPMIDSVGPRFDPSLHSGGNGQGSGNNTSNSNSSSSSSSSGGSKTTKPVVVRRATSGVPPG